MPKVSSIPILSGEELKSYRSAYNVPDWQDASQYEYVKNLKPDQLRWEFLRRDDKYRQFKDTPETASFDYLLGRYIQPDKRGDDLSDSFCFLDSKRQGYGILIPPPPTHSFLFSRHGIDPQVPGGVIDGYYGLKVRELLENDFLIVVLDPVKPISSQIKEVRKFYTERRKVIENKFPDRLTQKGSKRKIQIKDAVKLLRVLDAYNEGVSYKVIGLTLYNTKSKSDRATVAHQHVKRAKSYYRSL